ncbi:hypothetical protein [Nitrospina gracilis]|uniref:hypothetical protein n=1 Tax=Nitrospina gracilis TaxID=35801 RepID=UPI001F3409F7|nr:hypothetical protein [Nitrospina gracilis]MCF8720427.1 hypothetical protein [Nitrospina gracilis Nb-211]
MVLGIEDITGGTTILAFFIWLGLTGLFYLVCYMAALNTFDDLTGNHPVKLLAMAGIAPLSAFLMAMFDYNPTVLFVLMAISNFYRVKNAARSDVTRFKGKNASKPLFYTASYLYICAVFGLALWFQNPVETGEATQPYWKTWFPQE